MIAHVQAEVILDSARDCRSFQICLCVRGKRQLNAAVYRGQLDRRICQPVEVRLHPAVDGLKFDFAQQALCPQSSIDARGADFAGGAVNIQWPVDQFDFVEAGSARDSQCVLNPGRIVWCAAESVVVIRVLGADGNGVAAGLNFDPGFIESLFRAGIFDRVNFDHILVPRGDMNCAIKVVELDSASGSERIILVELLGVPPYIRGIALRDEEQRAKTSENGTDPWGEATLAVHGSSVSTEVRRGKTEFVSGSDQDNSHADAMVTASVPVAQDRQDFGLLDSCPLL